MIRKTLNSSVRHRATVVRRACALTLVVGAFLVAAPSNSATSIGGSDVAVLSTPALESIAASDLMLIGPVETLNHRQGVLRVLGQTVRVPDGWLISRQIVLGTVVSVYGEIAADGSVISRTIARVSSSYVAGSTPAVVRGRITALNSALGTLQVGRLLVDYTSSLYSLDASRLRIGSVVLFAGIQPSAGSVFLAQSTLADAPDGSASTSSISGSDLYKSSIGGSDLSSIGGSDRYKGSIGGSDLSSIGGSDRYKGSIGGSDLSSIGGSDRYKGSIGGSDLSSIGGSDLNKSSIGGSDLSSIGGSDLSSIGSSDWR